MRGNKLVSPTFFPTLITMAKMGEDFFLRTNSKINGEAATKKWVMNVINRVERRKKKKNTITDRINSLALFSIIIYLYESQIKKKKIRKR